MNKNIVIGVLVGVLILTLGYAAFKNSEEMNLSNQNASSTNPVGTVDTQTDGTNQTPAPVVTKTPSAPGVLTSRIVTISNSTAFVSGNVTPNGSFTSYWYDYGLTTDVSMGHTSRQNIGGGYTSITSPALITGLKANTQYYFRLNAENSLGVSQGAVFGFVTNNTAPVPGKAPTVQTSSVSNIGRTYANLNASLNPNGYTSSWWFEYGETASLGNLTTFQSTNNGQTSIAVTTSLANLKPLTKYYYRINAQNQFGTTNGSIGSFTTAGPAAVTAGEPVVKTNAVTNLGTSTVTLNGRLDPHGADTTYWFEYTTDSLLGRLTGTQSINTMSTPSQSMNGADAAIGVKADISGLDRNTKYYYRMIAQNQYGTVEGSVVSFRTK